MLQRKKQQNSKVQPIILPETANSTLVETMVAIEFAASWKPLIKSKINASAIMMINSKGKSILYKFLRLMKIDLCVFNNNAFNSIGYVFRFISYDF